MLADVQSPWRFHRLKSIRLIFKAGQLAAYCEHSRLECPYAGNVKTSKHKRTPRGAQMASWRRKAWLAGFDLQKKAMEPK